MNDTDRERQDAHTISKTGNREGSDTGTTLAGVARQIRDAADALDHERHRRGGTPMNAPMITEADWLLAVENNRRDLAAASLRGDSANTARLRADYERLQTWRPGSAR